MWASPYLSLQHPDLSAHAGPWGSTLLLSWLSVSTLPFVELDSNSPTQWGSTMIVNQQLKHYKIQSHVNNTNSLTGSRLTTEASLWVHP